MSVGHREHVSEKEHRQEAEGLIHIARGGLVRLFRQVAGQRYVLLLADSVRDRRFRISSISRKA